MEQYSTDPALNVAYNKGVQAAQDGVAKTRCPYGDYRTTSGKVTFSRAFYRAWIAGYEDAEQTLR